MHVGASCVCPCAECNCEFISTGKFVVNADAESSGTQGQMTCPSLQEAKAATEQELHEDEPDASVTHDDDLGPQEYQPSEAGTNFEEETPTETFLSVHMRDDWNLPEVVDYNVPLIRLLQPQRMTSQNLDERNDEIVHRFLKMKGLYCLYRI